MPDNRPEIGLYAKLSRRGRPKTLSGKIFLIGFLGSQLPLVALVAYAIMSTDMLETDRVNILAIAVVATLVGTLLTLLALKQLLVPISLTYRALRRYLEHDRLPDLPTQFTDEAGVLMADTTYVISRLDQAMHHMVNFDAATALPNRTLFTRSVQEAISELHDEHDGVVVFSVEIQGLDNLASGLGPEALAQALTTVAHRLSDATMDDIIVARLGDSTFGVLVGGEHEDAELETFARWILEAIEQPVLCGETVITLRGMVGIAIYPRDGITAEALIAASESALLVAKASPGLPFGYYSVAANNLLKERFELEVALLKAIDEDGLDLYYQPIVNTTSDNITGAEALIRWNHPEKGLISPSVFIPLAEASGHISRLGRWVLRRACQDIRQLSAESAEFHHVSINLSPVQLLDPQLVATISEVLAEFELEPSKIQFEVTESAVVDSNGPAIQQLHELRALGVKIALDDFGTGYSSLSHLKELPIDVLKVDQTFVEGLAEGNADMAIVQTIITLARSLKIDLVAEGVERASQAEMLRSMGCGTMQGYYFGRPVAVADIFKQPLLRTA